MFLADALTLDSPRKTSEGFLAVRAKASRTGVYQYSGREIDPDNKHGLRDEALVNVLRDGKTVFDKKAVHSFIGKPITDNHPAVPVSAENWRDHARGVVMGAKWEEGGYLAFDLLLTDKAAIGAVEGGKRELSNGYGAELEFGDFTADDGTKCPVRQSAIRGNHVAIVDRGRAGADCRIADAARCVSLPADVFELLVDGQTYPRATNDDKNSPQRRETVEPGASQMATKTITFDGLPVEVTDAAEAVIRKLEGQIATIDAAKAKAETDLAKAVTDGSTKDAKIVTLEKQIEDAKVTPAQLRDAAKSYQLIVDKAKALGVAVTEAMDEAAIMKAVVTAKVGDAAKDWNDVQVAASFATIAVDSKPRGIDPVRRAIADGAVTLSDTKSIHDAARAARVR